MNKTVTRDFSREITQLTKRFSIIKPIYSSQIHEVLLLHDQLFDRRVICKKLKDQFDSIENQLALKQEFIQIIELNHPNIIRGYEFYQENNFTFYTIEYIEELFQVESIGAYVDQILMVFSHLHQHHIVHRDIKENNFLFQEDRLYLIDFSMAKTATPKEIEQESLTLIRYLIGWLNKLLNISILDQPRLAKKQLSRYALDQIQAIFRGKQHILKY